MSDTKQKDLTAGVMRPATHGLDESESERHIRRLGPSFTHYLFSASKTVQVHDLNNRATQRVLSELMGILNELLKIEGRVSVRITSDFLVINEVRVTVDPQNIGPLLYLVEEMKKRDVEGIDFLPGVPIEEVGAFLKSFFRDVHEEGIFERLTSELTTVGIEHIRLTQWVEREKRFRDNTERIENVREQSNQAFFRTTALVGEVLKGIEQQRPVQIQKAERLTQQMVDILQIDESVLVGLTSLKDFDESTFRHSVNVSVLSMLIADRLQFHKSDVARVGVAALFHDVGKTYVPQAILNKPGKLEGQDWELMKYHTFFGVKELSRIKSLRDVGDGLFTALQHHVHYNDNGYPQKPGGWNLRLISRITTVADYFDAMTTPRVYQDPCTPDKTLLFILQRSGEIFDPFIAKVFIQTMGIYPVGTVVELDTGEKAAVVRQSENRRFIHRPVVALLGTSGMSEDLIDLAERSGHGRGYRRTVVRAFYEKAAEISKSQLFLTDPSQEESP